MNMINNLINMDNVNLYEKRVFKVKELNLKDDELIELSALEDAYKILTVYHNYILDDFTGEYNYKFCQGSICDDTDVTIYVLNEMINKDAYQIMEFVIKKELDKECGNCMNGQRYVFFDKTNSFLNKYKQQVKRKIPWFGFTEKDLENILIDNLGKIEKGLKLIKAQYPVNNGFIDILAEDKNGVKCD